MNVVLIQRLEILFIYLFKIMIKCTNKNAELYNLKSITYPGRIYKHDFIPLVLIKYFTLELQD